MASSFSLAQLIVARCVLGFGSGGYTATIPVWQSELSGAEHRGAFVNAEGIFLGLGIVIALLLDFGFFFVTDNTVSWRLPFAIQIVFLLTVMAFIFTLPESPRWLGKKGRLEEASEVIAVLNDLPANAETIKRDIAMMQQSLFANAAKTGSLRSLLRMGDQRIFNRTMIAVLGQLFQQMCGCSLTVAYATVTTSGLWCGQIARSSYRYGKSYDFWRCWYRRDCRPLRPPATDAAKLHRHDNLYGCSGWDHFDTEQHRRSVRCHVFPFPLYPLLRTGLP